MSFLARLTGVFALAGLYQYSSAQDTVSQPAVQADGTSFALNGNEVSYRFHVDPSTGDLIGDHFGGSAYETVAIPDPIVNGWVGLPGRVRREFPDLGRGDFRTPAVRIRQSEGYTVSDLQYQSYQIVQGKPELSGMPSLFGSETDVTTLVVRLYDNYSSVAADLTYSVFPAYDAVVRSVNITNMGDAAITVEKLASFSVDLPYEELDMIELRGDWARENMRTKRKVEYGTQGFGSTTGYSSHLHNPFLALQPPSTTETSGEVWGFSLIYTGSFAAEVEKGSQGFTRAMLGFNPNLLSWPLGPGETLTSPEVVAVYSSTGTGGLSRAYHSLFRNHLIKSDVYRNATRPVLLNSWEGLYFDYNQSTIENLAGEAAALGVKLFVLDDGWFGEQYPRVDDEAGLGDWEVNTAKFPSGSLAPVVEAVTNLTAAGSTEKLRFGLWFEPEMVNPNSTLYNDHPDWVLSAGAYPRTLRRDQLVLNVALPEVQDFIITSVGTILRSAAITYVKWDNNRGMHELPAPGADHAYMLGLYRVFANLTSTFPDVLWEGCASGGGRFDPGVLAYFPQIWTSDNTDALARLSIQFGTSLVYPPAAMGAHVSAVPNGQTGRDGIPIAFRAHVAMMGGSFGLELDPAKESAEDRDAIPPLIALAERVGPLVITGGFWRLQLPEESNWPAAMFVAENGSQAVVFWFQVRSSWNMARPYLRLQGLEGAARYRVGENGTYSGATLMNVGLQWDFRGDYDSTVLLLERL